jgi:hypothetical protein
MQPRQCRGDVQQASFFRRRSSTVCGFPSPRSMVFATPVTRESIVGERGTRLGEIDPCRSAGGCSKGRRSKRRFGGRAVLSLRAERGGGQRGIGVVPSSTANAEEQCWHGKNAQMLMNEREATRESRLPEKGCKGNSRRDDIRASRPERVQGGCRSLVSSGASW